MKKLRQLYYKIFKRYTVLETKLVSYKEGDEMLRGTEKAVEKDKWVLAEEEDYNYARGMVYLCRKVRIVE